MVQWELKDSIEPWNTGRRALSWMNQLCVVSRIHRKCFSKNLKCLTKLSHLKDSFHFLFSQLIESQYAQNRLKRSFSCSGPEIIIEDWLLSWLCFSQFTLDHYYWRNYEEQQERLPLTKTNWRHNVLIKRNVNL